MWFAPEVLDECGRSLSLYISIATGWDKTNPSALTAILSQMANGVRVAFLVGLKYFPCIFT